MSYGINADDGNRTDELEFVDDNTHDSGEESLIPNKKVSRMQHYPDHRPIQIKKEIAI